MSDRKTGQDSPCAGTGRSFYDDTQVYYGHGPDANGRWEPLQEHLRAVSGTAACFLEGTPLEAEARLAGILHDLGKYGELFQKRLRGEAGGVDHWSLGAWAALINHKATGVAAAIHGHHLGLKRINANDLARLNPATLAQNHPLNLTLSEPDLEKLLSRMEADGLAAESPVSLSYQKLRDTASAMLDVRMLYSAIVDADFLCTEKHFKTGVPRWSRPIAPPLNPGAALECLMAHMQTVRANSDSAQSVNNLRDDLMDACLSAASGKPGVWTLTAPTGAGKTLAMLAFALKHAKENGLRRVICVVPYLTIIEQTADVYRNVFGEDFRRSYILEHHSLVGVRETDNRIGGEADSDNESLRERLLLAENWDAPVIITTSVQMLESLFASRVSPCRKLHRLANSVILFDEIQTLPQSLAVATLATLSHLSERYGASIVFSTATQPAFTALSVPVASMKDSGIGWSPKEIAPPNMKLFERARRTKAVWLDTGKQLSWPDVADLMADHPQALCIVNLKRHAHALMGELRTCEAEGLKHLSTSMCPAHRTVVLDDVRKRLTDSEPCVLVATQCVEAGVDLDFPVVFRALGPLDSIAQAAGRCNRGGRTEIKDVHIFIPEDEAYPKGGGYEQAAAVTLSLLKEIGPGGMDIHDTKLFERYYRDLYSIARAWDVGKAADLREAIEDQDFEEVTKLYRLIKEDTVSLLVPYEAEQERYDALCAEVRDTGLTGDWIRRARALTISIFRPREDAPVLQRMERIRVGRNDFADDWFIYLCPDDYNKDVGFIPPQVDAINIA